MAVDDATQLAYVEMLSQEQEGIIIGIMVKVVNWFNCRDYRLAEAKNYS